MLGRKDPALVRSLLEGHGYQVLEVEGDDVPGMHHRFSEALREAYATIAAIQADARANGAPAEPPRWPMIVLRSPKGWTGPQEIDGIEVTGSWRSHQVPLSGVKGNPEHLALLDTWLRSYRPEELFDEQRGPGRARHPGEPDRGRAAERQPARQRWSAHRGPRHPRLPGLRGRSDEPGRCGRVGPPPRRADRGDLPSQPAHASGCSARTRPTATGSGRSSTSPTAPSWRRCCRPTPTSPTTAG